MMVAAEREHAKAAQQIEIAHLLPVIEILPASLAKSDVIPDGLENADHLLVEATFVEVEASGFVGLEQRTNVRIRTRKNIHVVPGRRNFHHPIQRRRGSNAA